MSDRLVVVDVDGTLTRSDVRGYVETVYLGVYDYIHTGVVDFLNNLVWCKPMLPPSRHCVVYCVACNLTVVSTMPNTPPVTF